MISIRFKRGTAAQISALVEAAGVLSINEETYAIHVHDGVTSGGHVINNVSSIEDLQQQIDALGIADVDGLEVALASKVAITELGVADGVAQLNPEGVVPTEQLPSYVEDVIEVADLASLPATGEVGKLYVLLDTNELYRWSGGQSRYYRITAVIESTDDLSEGQVKLYFTEARVRDAFSAEGDLTYDPQTGVLSYAASVSAVEGRSGEVIVGKDDVDLGLVQNFGVASEQEAQEGVVSDKYLTSALTRSLVEHMGFTDSTGDWAFSAQMLAALALLEEWSQLTSGPLAVRFHSAVTINGKMYVYGGWDGSNNLYEYDPATDSWTTLTSGPAAIFGHSAVVINGKMYIYGGRDSNNNNRNTLYEYNPATDSWATLTSGPVAVRLHSAVVINGKMYVYGGYDGSARNTLYAYDPATDSWATMTSGPIALYYHSAVVINGKMYAYGGWDGSYSNNLYEYDPATDSWSQLSAGPAGINGHSAVTINGKMYVYGGWDGSARNTLYEYDPATDSWATLTSGPLAVRLHSAVTINGKMYVYGGLDGGSFTVNTLYLLE